MPKRFTSMHIGNMDFHGRNEGTRNSIGQCDRGMRICSSVEHNAQAFAISHGTSGFMDPIDEFTFVIRLSKDHFDSKLCAHLLATLLNISQCLAAISIRITYTQQAEVRTV